MDDKEFLELVKNSEKEIREILGPYAPTEVSIGQPAPEKKTVGEIDWDAFKALSIEKDHALKMDMIQLFDLQALCNIGTQLERIADRLDDGMIGGFPSRT